jgi:hypothetical protein
MSDNKTATGDNTTINQVDIDIDDIFGGAPGSTSVVVPDGSQKNANMFSKGDIDMSFIDDDDDDDSSSEDSAGTDDKADDKKDDSKADKIDLDSLLNDDQDADSDQDDTKPGRKKVDKSGLVDVMSKLIEEEIIIPFDDDKSIEDYSLSDWKELLEANFQERENKVRQETPQEFFESLPEELQYAAKYVADGGQDLKGLFRALAESEEVRELAIDNESDQEEIIRQYLLNTGFGTVEEISEEIDTWKDLGKLEQQAKKFKPKLDAMQEEILRDKLAEQEQMKKQQELAARQYMSNVYEALKPGEINGIKLDKKTQASLYQGLVQPQYPSYMSGKKTNLLGHLLEKYQFVEPNYGLIAEAAWLLSDPDGYRSKVQEIGKTKAVEKTVRQLKSEQANRSSSTPQNDGDDDRNSRRSIPRPGGFFKRN